VLKSKGKLESFTEEGVVWKNGETEGFDAIIWCTGFQAATNHLDKLVATDTNGKVKTQGTRALKTSGLWLVGYGGWTGFASATLIAVGRSARATVKEITDYLKN
jgi:thioredoxin reductase